ncbi:MAG: HEAT repeat domain-containing protein, partial [Candidatus Omnitrophica bacterium]|nr:HEAT repeat domain-containing protein [Candidatus Omnitrophota bacterium]
MLKSNSTFVLAIATLLAGATGLFGQNPTPLIVQSEDKLIAVLKSDASQKDKVDACRQLAVIGTRNAVPPLVALLGDEQLSHMARYALETIPDPSVDEALRNALVAFRGKPLIGVIGSIGVRRDTEAIPLLAEKLSDLDPVVVRTAAGSLGQIGTLSAAKALEEAWANTPAPRHLDFAEGMLRCAEALAAKGLRKDALAIYDCLRWAQAPHQVRAAGLRGAILASEDDGLALLRKSIRSHDFVLVDAAIRTAIEMPGSEVTQTLASELNKSTLSTDVQVLLAQTMGYRGDPAGLWALYNKVGNANKPVRLAAIRALPEIGNPGSVPVLAQLMRDSDQEISQTARESLAAFACPEADAAVVKMLDSDQAGQRVTGIELVGRRRMAACVPTLLKAAGDTDAQVRPAAFKVLADLAGSNELPVLLDLLAGAKESQDLDAAEQAVNAVCSRANDPETCVERLAGRLPQVAAPQKSALLRVLGTVGGAKALEVVRAAVDNSDTQVHGAAIRVLGAWKGDQGIA